MRKWIARIPLATSVLFGVSYVSQMARMWTERSAAGQSISGWVQVAVALVLFYIYYGEMLPNDKLPKHCVAFEFVLVGAIIATTIYFRSIS